MNSLKSHSITDVSIYAEPVIEIIRDLQNQPMLDEKQLGALLRRHSRDYSGVFSKNLVIRTYRHLCENGELEPDPALLQRLRMIFTTIYYAMAERVRKSRSRQLGLHRSASP